MKRRWAAVAGGVLLAVGLVGCGDNPPPVQEAKPIEQPKPEEDKLIPPAKPAASDDAGGKLLAEVLAAHTGGKPDKLAALRECSFTRKGLLQGPDRMVPSTWSVQLAWPDKYRAVTELQPQPGVKTQITFALTPAGAWRRKEGEKDKTPLEPENKADFTTQFHEDALFLLFVLADPKTVVTRGTDETVGDAEQYVLHVWTPAVEYARLDISRKTKLVSRFAYNGREMNTPVVKEVVFTEYKEFAGVKLASKLYVKGKGHLLAEWTELTVDATKPDPKVFDGP